MVKIRLRRQGLKKQAAYRLVAADKESPRDGRFLEILGSYNPRTEPFTFDRVKAGEDAEKVLAEAKEYYANRPVEKKTRLAARK